MKRAAKLDALHIYMFHIYMLLVKKLLDLSSAAECNHSSPCPREKVALQSFFSQTCVLSIFQIRDYFGSNVLTNSPQYGWTFRTSYHKGLA